MRLGFGLGMLLLAGCAPSGGPQRVVEERAFTGTAPRGTAPMRQAMLTGHTAARAEVGLGPLAWDDTLAADAQLYADELARTGKFEHSQEPRGRQREGENLWTGTRGAYRYEEMIGHWVAEKAFYRRGITPDFSTTGRWEDVAHYTEIVWHSTTRVGCATASNARDDYLVCRYTPPGNVVGEVAF